MLGWIIKTVNVPMGGIMYNDKFNQIADTIKDLGKSCEQLGIQYTTKLSTLEVAVSQQMIQIKKLEEETESQKVTIKYLMAERGEYPNEPEPHPYTHPIRDVPDYSRVKER